MAGAAAGRKEAGAGTEVDPYNATGKLRAPHGWTCRPESSPTRGGSPGIFCAGTLISPRFYRTGWEDHRIDSGTLLFS